MKHFRFFPLLLICTVFTLLTNSCTEVPPYIDFGEEQETPDLTCEDKTLLSEDEFSYTNTSYISSNLPLEQCKMVLIEEFSGVRCVRCPAGHEVVERLLENHPNQVAAVTMHAGFLSAPYPDNKEDYVLEEGKFLYDAFKSIALPAAAIDRVDYEDQDFVAITFREAWSGKVNQRLEADVPLNLYIQYDFNPSNRLLQVFVKGHFLKNFDAEAQLALGVSLTESHIIDLQLVPEGETSSEIQADYEHNHVLRKMLTPPLGTNLEVNAVEGRVIERVFELNLPEHWRAENMEIIAFVHDSNQVLQAAKKAIEID